MTGSTIAARGRLRIGLPGGEAWWTVLAWGLAAISLVYGYGTSFLRLGAVQSESVEEPMARLGRVLIESFLFAMGGTGIILAAPSLLRSRVRWVGVAVLAGYGAYLGGRLLSCFLGTVPEFYRTILGEALLLAAVAIVPPPPTAVWRRAAERALCALYVWLTLVLVVVDRANTVQRYYDQGFIPGINQRLHGYLHANNLAAVLFVYLMLMLLKHRQQGWRWFDWVNVGLAVAMQLAAQSKTTVGLLVVFAGLHVLGAFRRARPLTRLAGALTMVLALCVLGFASTTDSKVNDAIRKRLTERKESLQSLTGRDRIWAISLEKWRENTWFGYGPGLWGPEMGQRYLPELGWVVFHSHNQYLQVLGASGLLGLAGLLAYLGVLVGLAAGPGARQGPVPLYLIAYMILRGGTEVAIGHRGYANGSLLVQLIVEITILAAAKEALTPAIPAERPASAPLPALGGSAP